MTISNGLAAAALCLDGQQMVFIECPVLPYPEVKIHKMAPWEPPPPWFGVSSIPHPPCLVSGAHDGSLAPPRERTPNDGSLAPPDY